MTQTKEQRLIAAQNDLAAVVTKHKLSSIEMEYCACILLGTALGNMRRTEVNDRDLHAIGLASLMIQIKLDNPQDA